MNPDKRIIIDDLTARVNASPFLIVVDYTSITVPEFTNLRSALAACGAQCHVAKNNFMRTALTDAGLPADRGTPRRPDRFRDRRIRRSRRRQGHQHLCQGFQESRIQGGDPGWSHSFRGRNPRPSANCLPRDQLLAKLLGTINAAGSALARVIQAYVDKENGGSEEPAA